MVDARSDLNTITMTRQSPLYDIRLKSDQKLDVQYIVRKHSLEDLHKEGEKLPFPIGFFDAVYDMDFRVRSGNKPEPTTADVISRFGTTFRALTTLDSFSLVISCSFAQAEGFMQAMLSSVCYHVSRVFWIKPNTKASNVDTKRYTNCVEVFLVGFGKKHPQKTSKTGANAASASKSNSEIPEPWQHRFDINGKEDERVAVARKNYISSTAVEKFATFNSQVRFDRFILLLLFSFICI